ncbi:MAG: hypothetical protein CVU48_03115 [Candidatus Cloacimonetes bacterium HGW-Cloacimonetes-1]|nr:MAG: hypothetical protein CVU48_03115 [Candidatus Cloacimonetes bacterium HGW-Cloacimonetes-1]
MSKYSLYGSELIDSKIDHILCVVRQEFLKVFPIEELKALVLGGGYGRGEGGVRFEGDDEFPYNDLDFFVISRDIPLYKKLKYQKALAELHYKLTDQLGIDIDFSPIQSLRALPQAPFWLVWYELRYGHRIVIGNTHILNYLPRWEDDSVPLIEAVKLLLNRGVGLWKAKQVISEDTGTGDLDFVMRNIHKAIQAIGDSILISRHQYHWSNIKRMERAQTTFKELPFLHNEFTAQYINSMEFKLQPQYSDLSAGEMLTIIENLIPTFIDAYYYIWACMVSRNSIGPENYYREIQAYFTNNLLEKDVLKNLVLNIKEFKFSAYSHELYCQYPRYRLICTFPWFLWNEELVHTDIDKCLSLSYGSTQDLRYNRFIELWEKYN